MVTTVNLLKVQRRDCEPCLLIERVVPPSLIVGATSRELALVEGPEIFVVVPSDVPCVAGEKHPMFHVSSSVRHAVRRIAARDLGLDPTLNTEILSRQKNVLEEARQMSTAAQ